MSIAAMKTGTLIDRFGETTEKIKELEDYLTELREEIDDRRITNDEGRKFRFFVTKYRRKVLDAKKLYRDYGITDEVLSEYKKNQRCTRTNILRKGD